MIKKLIITVFAVLALLELLIVVSLPALIHKDAIKAEITNGFKQVTGLNLEIQGDVNVVSFPVPHVVINSLDVHNAPGALSPFLLEIKLLEVWPSIPSLFHGKLLINSIKVSGVDVEPERMKSTQMSWKDNTLQPPGAAVPSQPSDPALSATEITVSDAVIRYTDTPANTVLEFDDVGVILSGGTQTERNLQIAARYNNVPFAISGRIGELAQIISSGTVPANFDVKSGKSSLAYAGDIGIKDNRPFIKGKVAFETDDMVPLISLLLGNPARKAPVGAHYKPLPLKANSDINTEGEKVIFPNIALEGETVKGNVQAVVTTPNRVDVKAAINTFDLETLVASGLFDINNNVGGDTTKDDSATPVIPSKSVLGFLMLSADIKVADTLYNNQHIRDAHFTFDTSDGEVNIPQMSAVLPGDSRVVFTGIGKEGYQGFALEGEVDADGADFVKMMDIFKSKGFSLPAEDFKRFRLKANAVISTKDMRLSEIAARIENIWFVGGAIAKFGERTTLVAALRIGGINLDHFFTLWGLEEWRTSFLEDNPGPKYEGFLSRWLKHLGYDITFNTSLEQYTLNGKLRDRTDFKLEAKVGDLVFKNIKTSYNGSQLSGDVGINVLGPLPRLDLDITADAVDTAVFLSPDGKAPAPASPQATGERWTHNQFDFHWLTLLNAVYHLKFGHFRQGTFQADAMDIKGSIKDQVLNIDALTAVILGAQTVGRMSISGGKIPAVNMAADVKGISVDQLFFLFPALQGMTGKYNIDLRLDTNGTDTFSWVSNLEGTIGLGGRDIVIHNFNILGIISAVNYVRTVADILEVVKHALPGGDTLFSGVQGEWIVANGTLQASNMVLTSPYSDGMVKGEVDLVNWKTQNSTTFTLKSLDPTHPPSIIVSYSGDLGAPERMLDTRSLEQYITNKTSEKMLDQYGTH